MTTLEERKAALIADMNKAPDLEARKAALMSEMSPPVGPSESPLGAFNEGLVNEMLAASQGASPVTATLQGAENYPVVGELITGETDYGPANTMVNVGRGNVIPFDPDQHVVFSEGGRMRVFQRTPEMEEGRMSRLGRLFGLGSLVTPMQGAKVAAQSGPSRFAQNVQAIEEAGLTPTVPLAAEGTAPARLAQATRAVPFGGGPVERGMARTRAETEEALGATVEAYGEAADAETTGEALRAATKGWLDRWRKTGVQNDKNLSRSLRKAGVDEVKLDRTAEVFEDPFKMFDNEDLAKQFEDAWFQRLSKALEEGDDTVSLNDLYQLRRSIGKMMEKPMVVADQDRGQLKAIYRALSKDLEEAARKAGGEDLVKQVRERNKYWADGFDRIEKSLTQALDERVNPERVFERVMGAAAGKGARANMRYLRDLRNSVDPETWGDVASSVLLRMGTGPARGQTATSAFNPGTFLTNYRNMSKPARDLLFGGNRQAQRGLDRIVNDILPKTERAKEFENVSRSGEVGTAAATGGAMLTGLLSGNLGLTLGPLALMGGSNATGRALMNPRFTRWLAKVSGDGQKVQALGENFWPQRLAQLRTIVASNPELQPALEAYERAAAETQ